MNSEDELNKKWAGEGSETFEAIYQDYLAQIAELDFSRLAPRLGCTLEGEELLVPLLGRTYRVSPRGMLAPSGRRPIHAEAVLLSKYLLLAPEDPPRQNDWCAFKDFPNGAPFAGAFGTQVEKALAEAFSGRAEELERACEELQGEDPDMGLSYTLCRRFSALPRVPLLLLFEDLDEEFPAEARILFPDNAESYLDMECLAILGWLLKDFLRLAAGESGMSIM